MTDVFRQAASILVLRPVSVCAPGGKCDDVYQILIVHKPRKKDAWQLPQGGMEPGETVEQAALRELKEEASLTGCTVLGISNRVYEYTFPESYRRFRPDNIKGQQIRFVYALAPADAAVTVDNKEIDQYQWIDIRDLSRTVKRKAYVELVRDLYNEALKQVQDSKAK